jgi:mersacidin/lichenicidin family type 2 lantibiotic
MKKNQIIKAWKDSEYRDKLDMDTGSVPEHPAGWMNLSDSALGDVFGGNEFELAMMNTEGLLTVGCCNGTWGDFCTPIGTHGALTIGCCPLPPNN